MKSKIITAQYRIAETHPCLAGHFPDYPVIPAVVQLDYVLRLLCQWQPDKQLAAIPHAKFQQPLRPEQDFSITLTELDTKSIRFECARASQILSTGLLRVKVRS